MSLVIHHYQPDDYRAVREICSNTADKGEPVENFFSDREVFADLLTSYYTDFESQRLWVAEEEREVIGYLMGCFDSRRYIKIMAFYIVPKILLRAVIRGVFLKRETWQLFKAMLKSCQIGGFKRNIPLEIYPAHLHIDVKVGFRGRGIGKSLLEVFLKQAREKNIKGIHLAVREDNFSACKFFERMGFTLLSRHPIAMPGRHSFTIGYTLVYGKIL